VISNPSHSFLTVTIEISLRDSSIMLYTVDACFSPKLTSYMYSA
jgi:hypothetical protein